jgi:hypothetical protein
MIYSEQYQVARLLDDYYSGQSVALNDIGVAAYVADVKITDLFGLSTMTVTEAQRTNQFDVSTLERICSADDVKIAIVYNHVFRDQVFLHGNPRGWIEVGRSDLLRSMAGGDPMFVFYAVGPEQASLLRVHLDEFRRSVPPSVQTTGADDRRG